MRPRGLRHGRRQGVDDRRPARPRVLGAVVAGRLGLGDARADPALVLLAALHVGRDHRPGAVPQGARLREDARRDGPGDAQLVGEHDRCAGSVRADGRGRHALAVLRAAAGSEPVVRVRTGARDPAEAAHPVALGRLPRDLRRHRRVGAALGRPGGRSERAPRSTAGSSTAPRRSSRRRRPPTRRSSRSTSSARSMRSSTTSRTGTSAAPGGASGTATRPRSRRSGTRSSRRSA